MTKIKQVDTTKISAKFGSRKRLGGVLEVSRGVRAVLRRPRGASEPPVDNAFFGPKPFFKPKTVPKRTLRDPGGALWTRFASPGPSLP